MFYVFYTENVDYVPANQMLQFGPTLPSEIEFEITILSDDITEEEEQFIALLESNDSSVMISTSSATITIVDRSGTSCKSNFGNLISYTTATRLLPLIMQV